MSRKKAPGLTARQRAVCELVAEGLSSKQIARRLGIDYRTVDDHRLNAYRVLGVHNGVQMVRRLLKE
jgi:DNA-binding CsgD family transcriptional regulator